MDTERISTFVSSVKDIQRQGGVGSMVLPIDESASIQAIVRASQDVQFELVDNHNIIISLNVKDCSRIATDTLVELIILYYNIHKYN